jgi:hypothetical protein
MAVFHPIGTFHKAIDRNVLGARRHQPAYWRKDDVDQGVGDGPGVAVAM